MLSGFDEVKPELGPVSTGYVIAWGSHGNEVAPLLDLERRDFELNSEGCDGSPGDDVEAFSILDLFCTSMFDSKIVSFVAIEKAKHFAVGVKGRDFEIRKSSCDGPTWDSRSRANIEDSCFGVQVRDDFSNHDGVKEVTHVAILFWNSGEVHNLVRFVEVFLKVFEFGKLFLRETDSQFIACGG